MVILTMALLQQHDAGRDLVIERGRGIVLEGIRNWGRNRALKPTGLSVLSVCLWRWCIVAKRLDGQDETWHGGRPRPCYIVLDGDPAPPEGAQPANFRPMSVVAKWLDGSICHLVGR